MAINAREMPGLARRESRKLEPRDAAPQHERAGSHICQRCGRRCITFDLRHLAFGIRHSTFEIPGPSFAGRGNVECRMPNSECRSADARDRDYNSPALTLASTCWRKSS